MLAEGNVHTNTFVLVKKFPFDEKEEKEKKPYVVKLWETLKSTNKWKNAHLLSSIQSFFNPLLT